MMMIEVFKTGTHKSGGGDIRTWTNADLQKIAGDYNKSKHEAPVVIGHPADNLPAYGWVKSLVAENDKLLAELHQVQPEFSDWVNRKLFKKRSISLYPDGLLRHVGFLGAQPPALKGLEDFEFKSGEGFEQYEYEDTKISTKEDNMTLEELQKQLEETMKQLALLTQQVADLTAEKDKEKARADNAEAELEKVGSDYADATAKQVKAELQQFVDQLVADKKLLPKNKAAVLTFAEGLGIGSKVINFSDGDKTPLDAFKVLMSGLPQLTDLTLDFSDSAAGSQQQQTSEPIKKGQV